MPPRPNSPEPPLTIAAQAPMAGDQRHTIPPVRDATWRRAAHRARQLSWFSLLWMTGEGVVGIIAGVRASSISLLGWALGSVIEGLASVIVIWRFTGSRRLSETAEGRAQKAVAISFFLLAPYIVVEALRDLLDSSHGSGSALGVMVTTASLIVMPILGFAKQRLGRQLDSGATSGEGLQNLICAGQAAAVLMGLVATSALGWGWIDPAIGLVLAGWAVREGVEAWRDEDCC